MIIVMTGADDPVRAGLLRRGFTLEYLTLDWNVAGIVILAVTAVAARSVALAGFGLDSLIEIGPSVVVAWELSGTGDERQRRGPRLIGGAFTALALYLLIQSTVVLAAAYHPGHSLPGIAWTALTALVMFALAAGKARTGRALGNPVLRIEGRVTMIDGILAVAVLAGLALNAAAGWWWADPGGRLRAGVLRRPRGPRGLLPPPGTELQARACAHDSPAHSGTPTGPTAERPASPWSKKPATSPHRNVVIPGVQPTDSLRRTDIFTGLLQSFTGWAARRGACLVAGPLILPPNSACTF